MTMSVQAEEKDGYLFVIMSGVMTTAEDLAEMMEGVRSAVERHGLRKILIDQRPLRDKVPLSVRMLFLDNMMSQPARVRNCRYAALSSEDHFQANIDHALLLRNRGVVYKVFNDHGKALAWLEVNDLPV